MTPNLIKIRSPHLLPILHRLLTIRRVEASKQQIEKGSKCGDLILIRLGDT